MLINHIIQINLLQICTYEGRSMNDAAFINDFFVVSTLNVEIHFVAEKLTYHLQYN